jgi:hypothetical protein
MTTKSVGDRKLSDIQVATKDAAVLVTGTTIFTISGGPIIIEDLIAVCTTNNDATASTLQMSADGTDGSATTFTGASASLASAVAGSIVALIGTATSTAMALYANGVGITGGTHGIIVPAGIITSTVAIGSTTGKWKFYLRYRPLDGNVVVS